jgi:hypothetical protein
MRHSNRFDDDDDVVGIFGWIVLALMIAGMVGFILFR